jgi:hypothetical protein
MSRLWDVVIGGGIVVCLLALVGCCVQAVLEVLAVERDRRKMSGEVELTAGDAPAAVNTAAPSPDLSPAARVVAELEGRA